MICFLSKFELIIVCKDAFGCLCMTCLIYLDIRKINQSSLPLLWHQDPGSWGHQSTTTRQFIAPTRINTSRRLKRFSEIQKKKNKTFNVFCICLRFCQMFVPSFFVEALGIEPLDRHRRVQLSGSKAAARILFDQEFDHHQNDFRNQSVYNMCYI